MTTASSGDTAARQLHLGLALDGAGAHPASWRRPGAAEALLDPKRLTSLVRAAEAGGFGFVSLEDDFDAPGPGRPNVPFRLDATLALARLAPVTTTIGLLASASTTHTEPFHQNKNLATLDLVSGGRGAWHVTVSRTTEAAARFGRKGAAPEAELWAEADDAIEAVTRLWDSWEDDAVIRDVPTGRYLDREKVHYVDVEGRFFSVRGPSITPRSPQGQLPIAITVGDPASLVVAARRADIVIVTPRTFAEAQQARRTVRTAVAAAGRDADAVAVIVRARVGDPDLRATLDASVPPTATTHEIDLAGSAAALTDTLVHWFHHDAADGFLLLPDAVPETLEWLAHEVTPVLQGHGVLRAPTVGETLRDRLGLARPTNRYATTTHANANEVAS
jgi:alkanesulfonate monooxygenase SsuD/methylene tetrahydromethanopterin reductase-like flavin-dependent oxidoreductase (luciferase family)